MKVFAVLRACWALVAQELFEAEQRAKLRGVSYGARSVIRGADRIRVGRNVFIDCGAYLNPSTVNARAGYIHIGDDVEVGPYSVLWGGGGLTIGNNVHMGAHVHITTQQGRRLEIGGAPQTMVIDTAPVVIEDDVIVYSGAIIVPGVRVGKAATVAAGAVVTQDVEPGTFVAGVPARVVRLSPA